MSDPNRRPRPQRVASAIFAALSDPDIFETFVTVAGEEITAERQQALSANECKALGRLEGISLVEATADGPRVNLAAFAAGSNEIRELMLEARGPASGADVAINSHFTNGRLESLPRNSSARDEVLGWIVRTYFAQGSFSEPEVNAALRTLAHDHVTVRRALIDEGHLIRSRDGSTYSSASSSNGQEPAS